MQTKRKGWLGGTALAIEQAHKRSLMAIAKRSLMAIAKRSLTAIAVPTASIKEYPKGKQKKKILLKDFHFHQQDI